MFLLIQSLYFLPSAVCALRSLKAKHRLLKERVLNLSIMISFALQTSDQPNAILKRISGCWTITLLDSVRDEWPITMIRLRVLNYCFADSHYLITLCRFKFLICTQSAAFTGFVVTFTLHTIWDPGWLLMTFVVRLLFSLISTNVASWIGFLGWYN